MGLDMIEFFFREAAGLIQDAVLNPDFSDVMEGPARFKSVQVFRRASHPSCDFYGVVRNP